MRLHTPKFFSIIHNEQAYFKERWPYLAYYKYLGRLYFIFDTLARIVSSYLSVIFETATAKIRIFDWRKITYRANNLLSFFINISYCKVRFSLSLTMVSPVTTEMVSETPFELTIGLCVGGVVFIGLVYVGRYFFGPSSSNGGVNDVTQNQSIEELAKPCDAELMSEFARRLDALTREVLRAANLMRKAMTDSKQYDMASVRELQRAALDQGKSLADFMAESPHL